MVRWRSHKIATGSTRTSRASASQYSVTDVLTGVAKTAATVTLLSALTMGARAISRWWKAEESDDPKRNDTESGTPQSAIASGDVPENTTSGLSDGPTAFSNEQESQQVAQLIVEPESMVQGPSAQEARGDSPSTGSFDTPNVTVGAGLRLPLQNTPEYFEGCGPTQAAGGRRSAKKPSDAKYIRIDTSPGLSGPGNHTISSASSNNESPPSTATATFVPSLINNSPENGFYPPATSPQEDSPEIADQYDDLEPARAVAMSLAPDTVSSTAISSDPKLTTWAPNSWTERRPIPLSHPLAVNNPTDPCVSFPPDTPQVPRLPPNPDVPFVSHYGGTRRYPYRSHRRDLKKPLHPQEEVSDDEIRYGSSNPGHNTDRSSTDTLNTYREPTTRYQSRYTDNNFGTTGTNTDKRGFDPDYPAYGTDGDESSDLEDSRNDPGTRFKSSNPSSGSSRLRKVPTQRQRRGPSTRASQRGFSFLFKSGSLFGNKTGKNQRKR